MEQGVGQLWREEWSSAVRNGRRGLPEMKEEKGAGETGLAVSVIVWSQALLLKILLKRICKHPGMSGLGVFPLTGKKGRGCGFILAARIVTLPYTHPENVSRPLTLQVFSCTLGIEW